MSDDTPTKPLVAPVIPITTSVKVSARERASLLPGNFYDIRETADPTKRRRRRDWSEVKGICLHQTAVILGENVPRWETLGAHIGITRSGKVIWCHDFDWKVWHANGFNNQTVGIEIDGMYSGIEGNERTFWKPYPGAEPQTLTHEAAEAARSTIRWVMRYVAMRGGKVDVLVAHRQATKKRRADPGEAIWKSVALPFLSAKNAKLRDGGPGFQIDDGLPIPEAWDPDRVGIMY